MIDDKILSGDELDAGLIERIVASAIDIKANPRRFEERLRGKTLFLLFQKNLDADEARLRARHEEARRAHGGHGLG